MGSVLLDVKPWDDETDMKEMENLVRTIEMDGLLWGQAILKPIGYGINKLNVNCSLLESAPVIVIIYKRLQVCASCLEHFSPQMGSLLSNGVCRSGLYITRLVCDSYTDCVVFF